MFNMFIKSTSMDGVIIYMNFEKITYFETYGFLGIIFFFGGDDIKELKFISEQARNKAMDKILAYQKVIYICDLNDEKI